MFSEDQIKAAFWKTFHESGELWFPYQHEGSTDPSAKECEDSTNTVWQEFLDNLKGK